jgi:hypothetical protein
MTSNLNKKFKIMWGGLKKIGANKLKRKEKIFPECLSLALGE